MFALISTRLGKTFDASRAMVMSSKSALSTCGFTAERRTRKYVAQHIAMGYRVTLEPAD